ncbi:MAG: hypothetical protein ACI841_001085 [Planctomycetota bacterium]|jgi:hypothetical protein
MRLAESRPRAAAMTRSAVLRLRSCLGSLLEGSELDRSPSQTEFESDSGYFGYRRIPPFRTAACLTASRYATSSCVSHRGWRDLGSGQHEDALAWTGSQIFSLQLFRLRLHFSLNLAPARGRHRLRHKKDEAECGYAYASRLPCAYESIRPKKSEPDDLTWHLNCNGRGPHTGLSLTHHHGVIPPPP